MSQNISLLGASYSDVPSVLLPKTGGGTAAFTDVSDTTAAAADVASGKYFYTAAGVLTAGTASGGGGASNIVTGTFTGTTTGAAMDVTLAYTGSGYPIVVNIYPTGGIEGNSTFNSLVQRYVFAMYSCTKTDMGTAPSYSGTSGKDNLTSVYRYKSSASSARNYSQGSTNQLCYNADLAPTSTNYTVGFRSKTKMAVFIASTSYGFAANIEYTYHVIYSS